MYPLKAATTKGCLRKLTEHCVKKVIKPKVILSDHGSEFTSHIWKDTLENLGITVRYSPIRHPESNPAERVMKELGKFFKIYCSRTHKRWPEFVNHIQNCLNQSVRQSTGYKPIEFFETGAKSEIFREIIRNLSNNPLEDLPTKILKAYNRAKSKAEKRIRKEKKNLNGNPK
jgi:transposase InsO family protein